MNTVAAHINRSRLDSKGNWYAGILHVNWNDGTTSRVKYKGFRTWLQILEVDGLKAGFPMDMSATAFKERLNVAFHCANTFTTIPAKFV